MLVVETIPAGGPAGKTWGCICLVADGEGILSVRGLKGTSMEEALKLSSFEVDAFVDLAAEAKELSRDMPEFDSPRVGSVPA